MEDHDDFEHKNVVVVASIIASGVLLFGLLGVLNSF